MTWHVGIDPASSNAGLAALRDDGELRTRLLHVTGNPEDRFVELRRQAREWLRFVADDGCFCVVVERPVTRGHGETGGGATLMGSYGVLVEAARSMLPSTPLIVLASATWKKHALANGAAKKHDVMAHARLLGYSGRSQDVADAIGCADAARVLARTAEAVA